MSTPVYHCVPALYQVADFIINSTFMDWVLFYFCVFYHLQLSARWHIYVRFIVCIRERHKVRRSRLDLRWCEQETQVDLLFSCDCHKVEVIPDQNVYELVSTKRKILGFSTAATEKPKPHGKTKYYLPSGNVNLLKQSYRFSFHLNALYIYLDIGVINYNILLYSPYMITKYQHFPVCTQ